MSPIPDVERGVTVDPIRRCPTAPYLAPLEQLPYLWLCCAAASILTTKELFVSAGLNFPVHIHFLHWTVVCLYYVVEYLRNDGHHASEPSNLMSVQRRTMIIASCIAISLICTHQAVLHAPHTTGLVMSVTTSIAFLSALWPEIIHTRGHTGRLDALAWALPCMVGCISIILFNYRNTAKGLTFTAVLVVSTAIARAIFFSAVEEPFTATNMQRLNCWSCWLGLILTMMVLNAFTETTWAMMWDLFDWKYAPLLAVNVVCTSMAMILGKSLFMPLMDWELPPSPSNCHQSRLWDLVAVVLLTGIVGTYESLTKRRTCVTFPQFVGFVLAVSSLAYGRLRASHQGQTYGEQGRIDFDSNPQSTRNDEELNDNPEELVFSGETGFCRSSDRIPTHGYFWLIMMAILIWLAFIHINFRQDAISRANSAAPVLDLDYKPAIASEIVISTYKEPISEVLNLITNVKQSAGLPKARVTIYSKYEDANISNIKSLTGANSVQSLPNVGREGETYLHHILSNWNHLAHQTFFLQAEVHNPSEFYPRIRNYFVPSKTGMLNLGWSGNVCNCHRCTDQYMFFDQNNIFARIHDQINNGTDCRDILLSYKGQFVVSAARIRGVPKSVYQDLKDMLIDPDAFAHLQSPMDERLRQGDPSKPVFGYYVERMWNLLFQCSDTDVAWKCPTLLSGWRIGGTKADCQCFDDFEDDVAPGISEANEERPLT